MFEALSLRREEVNRQSEALQDKVRMLTDNDKRAYYQICESKIKDPDTYATLNWFFVAGLHHFYLGAWVRGLINLILMAVGIVFIFDFGLIIIIFLFLIELGALFRSQIIVEAHNIRVKEQALRELNSG